MWLREWIHSVLRVRIVQIADAELDTRIALFVGSFRVIILMACMDGRGF